MEHTDRIATTRWAVLEPSAAANNLPPAAPGYLEAGGLLFYVTDCGRTWLVRDEHGLVQLKPATPSKDAVPVDEMFDREVCIVAEAADLLAECRGAGIYQDAGFFYYLTDAGDVWMLYGPKRTPVRMPCVPARASFVDVPPDDVAAAIVRMEEAG